MKTLSGPNIHATINSSLINDFYIAFNIISSLREKHRVDAGPIGNNRVDIQNLVLLFRIFKSGPGFIFGKNDQTTTRTILKSPFGTFGISLAGGQKASEDPCNPSQTAQPTSRQPLINIKIPTLFGRGNKNPPTPKPECTTVTPPTTQVAQPKPNPSVPVPPVPKPLPTSSVPTPTTSTVPPPSTSGQIVTSSTTIDPDQDLINSIFGEEPSVTTAQNNGAGLIDFKRPLS
ncbi:hypothetical protein V9T40_011898 [Parthenolecanium corni]|uniref:Uncharacterized protein n=1 Tax=Parthenolecanium corni TaxID=536013 RepID=A0AAN9XYU5_9HEMI